MFINKIGPQTYKYLFTGLYIEDSDSKPAKSTKREKNRIQFCEILLNSIPKHRYMSKDQFLIRQECKPTLLLY